MRRSRSGDVSATSMLSSCWPSMSSSGAILHDSAVLTCAKTDETQPKPSQPQRQDFLPPCCPNWRPERLRLQKHLKSPGPSRALDQWKKGGPERALGLRGATAQDLCWPPDFSSFHHIALKAYLKSTVSTLLVSLLRGIYSTCLKGKK